MKRRLVAFLDHLEDWMAVVGDERVWFGIGMAVPAFVLILLS